MSPAERQSIRLSASSFRDPAGRLFRYGDRILRVVNAAAAPELRAFLDSPLAQAAVDTGELVRTRYLDAVETGELASDLPEIGILPSSIVLEHERVEFASYPYEWPLEMLHEAARLTLGLAGRAAAKGFWLKDASPYNILYRGPKPIFIDILSFERRDPLDQTWLAYGQFVRTFLLVLLAGKYLGRSPRDLLLSRRDGPEPQEVYQWCRMLDRLRPGFFGMVTLPAWLHNRRTHEKTGVYNKRPAASAEQADFVVNGVLSGLRRSLKRLAPGAAQSNWTEYLDHKSLYAADQLAAKERFVREALEECRPHSVLDVGCNEGHFSLLAARSGARVVAIDSDPAVVGRVWRKAKAENANVLPLVIDLTRPSPGMGWMNQECPSFLDRARGSFNMVLMLAVLHHMLVTERIPLDSALQMASDLTTDTAVIEFVGPEDPMFASLVRGRDLLYRHLTVDEFERGATRLFDVVRVLKLEGLHRWLYFLRKKSRSGAKY